MSWTDDVLAVARAAAGDAVTGEEGFGPYTLGVPPLAWRTVLTALRDQEGFRYFDWLSAVDEAGVGADDFRVVCHVAALSTMRHVLVQTSLPRASAELESLVAVYAGAAWHERETHEMFGITFAGGVPLETLLLPDAFEGHPLRKDFVLASRVAKPWPGAKEPGESAADAHAAPSRRRVRPPGVPDPESWGPRPPGSPAPDPLEPARTTAPAVRPRRERRATEPGVGDG